MLAQIAQFLVETVTGFFVFALLARFHFQWLRVPFRNPLGEFVVAVSNWLVVPARRLIPSVFGFDLASLIGAWLLQFAGLWLVFAVNVGDLFAGSGAFYGVLATLALIDLVRYSLYMLVGAVIVQAVLSWVNPHAPMAPVFDVFSRPFLRPIQRIVPPIANVDLSPLVLLLVLQVLLIPVWYARSLVAAIT